MVKIYLHDLLQTKFSSKSDSNFAVGRKEKKGDREGCHELESESNWMPKPEEHNCSEMPSLDAVQS